MTKPIQAPTGFGLMVDLESVTYKLNKSGVTRSDGAAIPESNSNRDWREYLKWLDEGNTPAPEYTEQEIIDNARTEEISVLKSQLATQQVWMFRMVLEIWNALKINTDARNSDIDPDVLAKGVAWKTKLDRLKVIDE